MKTKKANFSPAKLAVVVCIAALAVTSLGLMYLHGMVRWHALWFVALIQLLPAFIQLVLLLPVGQMPEMFAEEIPEGKKEKRRWRRRKFLHSAKCFYVKNRTFFVAVPAVLGAAVIHLWFWNVGALSAARLGYLIPVILLALTAFTIVLEKWCRHVSSEDDTYTAAQLKGICSALRLIRLAYLLTAAASVLSLLAIYDADSILKVLLQILFVFETVFLTFTLVVRGVRRELDVKPEALVSFRGMDKDAGILTYLEENTGITMRSLWSLQFVKQTLPAAVLGVALALWLSTGLVQIGSHQEGALFRLGKLREKTLKPGFHLTLPWPFDRVEVTDTQSIGKVTIGFVPTEVQDNYWTKAHGGEEYRLLLGDGNEIASINLTIEYKINDLIKYRKNTADPVAILQAKAYEIITERTISTDLDTLLAADREAFSADFRKELTEKLSGYETGLEVVSVVLVSIHPPVEVAGIYQDIINAGIDAEYLILNAETIANTAVMSAKEEAEKVIGAAKVSQREQVAGAEASVKEFLASVDADKDNPGYYRYQKYINALTKAYGGAKLIIVGEGVDSANLYIGSLTQPAEQETQPAEQETQPETQAQDGQTNGGNE